MAQDLQIIASGLNKEPFNKKISILDLDSLSGPGALQFLNDVFAALDSVHDGDIAKEELQDLAVRFFSFLRSIRYPSPEGSEEKSSWRQDVVEGKRQVVMPILSWIVKNLPMVQQRVYLAKFLTKVDVPPELRADPDIGGMFAEQERVIAEFATVHKQYKQLKSVADEAETVRNEIRELRTQKEQTERRITDLRNRIRSIPGNRAEKESRMALAQSLREQREKHQQLSSKRMELVQLAPTQTGQIERLQDYTTKMTDEWLEMNPEKLLKRLEDRLSIQRRAVEEVLPRVIAEERAVVDELRDLLGVTDFTDRNLNELRIKAQMLQTEIFNMSDKLRGVGQDPKQVQLNFYRTQAEHAENKKRELTLRNDAMYKEVRQLERRMKLQLQKSGEEGNDMMDYSKLSARLFQESEDFEKKQLILKHLEAEKGNMLRTGAILAAENERINKVLMEWEKRTGVSPFSEVVSTGHSNNPLFMPVPRGDITALANRVGELERKVNERRIEVSALLDELQPIRQKHKIQQESSSQRKQADGGGNAKSGGETDMETRLSRTCEEVAALEDKVISIRNELEYAEILLKRAEFAKNNLEFLRSLNSSVERETTRLAELQSQQGESSITFASNSYQTSTWRDLDRLFDMKLAHVRQDLLNAETRFKDGANTSVSSSDRIVMTY